MATKKYSHRISYVLPLPDAPGGHRLGINGLAVDTEQSSLYSAGRDGTICTWDLHRQQQANIQSDVEDSDDDPFSDSHRVSESNSSSKPAQRTPTTLRHQIQAHTHWINDIKLVHNHSRLVSASSDTSIRLWPTDLPSAADIQPTTIGRHGDYVKVLSLPEYSSTWIASGGLDRKVYLWDMHKGCESLKIDTNQDDAGAKGSIYALYARPHVMASGGPDSMVRVWDPRSGKAITKLIGHTNNIRDLLINESGDTIISASSDQSVKIWSMTAGRCMSTLSMHNDSVWSLYSDLPDLGVFYSSDRSGLVMKTDTRRAESIDQGLSVAVLQEHEGVQRMVVENGYVWTATQRSSIQRWKDIDTTLEIEPAAPLFDEKQDEESASEKPDESAGKKKDETLRKIPRTAVAPLALASPFPGSPGTGDSPELAEELDIVVPIQMSPIETIEGQYGLIKHDLLNDRRHALTQDTAGEVLMWDILKCVPIKSFGKRHLDDVYHENNTEDTITSWCTIDTRIGCLTITLDAARCFDAEVYADEAGFEDISMFKEDQRLNYGKWVLRWLFANLINEELRRDHEYRQSLQVASKPNSTHRGEGGDSAKSLFGPNTPGFGGPSTHPNGTYTPLESPLTRPNDSSAQDYFSATPIVPQAAPGGAPSSEADASASTTSDNPPEKEEKTTKRSGSIFGKNLKLSFPRKLSRPSIDTTTKPPVEDKPAAPPAEELEKIEEKTKEKEPEYEENLKGVIDKIRAEYDAMLAERPDERPSTRITPSHETETPFLDIPPQTAIMVKEEISQAVVEADLYKGSVGSLANDADKLEGMAPTWLGELLLRNVIPFKEIQKLTFTLRPMDNLPAVIKTDPNSKVDTMRLNANRMLRAKKVIGYICERIDPEDPKNPNPFKPEEYLDLYCQNIKIQPNMTLYAIRTHIWRNGSDMIFYYKANGKRAIPPPGSVPSSRNGTQASSEPLAPGTPGSNADRGGGAAPPSGNSADA